MSETTASALRPPQLRRKVLARLLYILVFAVVIGWGLQRVSVAINESARPAGFAQGFVQGALMPVALPNLLVGLDVPIYALHNTGRTYKLGYTLGVNGCGAVFFGIFFRRLHRWRRQRPA